MKRIAKTLLVFIAGLAQHAAFAEVVLIAGTGFVTENIIRVSVDRTTAWRVFTEEVGEWWPADHTWWGDSSALTIDDFAGGCFCERNGANSAEHMRISYVDRANLMRMTGGLGPLQGLGMYGALEWGFLTSDPGTEITVTYRVNGINADGLADLALIVDQVQAAQLAALGTLLNNE